MEAGIGCTGLSAGETVAPQKLSVYYRELNRELGLSHMTEQGGGVSGVQLDQGDGLN